MRVVFDTSVLVAAVKSKTGASYALLRMLPSPHFELAISTALFLEWEDVLTRPQIVPDGLTSEDMLGFVQFIGSLSHRQERIYFRWRPQLRDPNDDMVLELALAASCEYIVTHNLRDFIGSELLGVKVLSPSRFLSIISSNQ